MNKPIDDIEQELLLQQAYAVYRGPITPPEWGYTGAFDMNGHFQCCEAGDRMPGHSWDINQRIDDASFGMGLHSKEQRERFVRAVNFCAGLTDADLDNVSARFLQLERDNYCNKLQQALLRCSELEAEVTRILRMYDWSLNRYPVSHTVEKKNKTNDDNKSSSGD